jgi:hypothetical protein
MNGNNYYITASFIPCNIDSYYSVIIITAYETCPNSVTGIVSHYPNAFHSNNRFDGDWGSN